jgi:hypothetical protein
MELVFSILENPMHYLPEMLVGNTSFERRNKAFSL